MQNFVLCLYLHPQSHQQTHFFMDFFAYFCNGMQISIQILALGFGSGIVRMSTSQFEHG